MTNERLLEIIAEAAEAAGAQWFKEFRRYAAEAADKYGAIFMLPPGAHEAQEMLQNFAKELRAVSDRTHREQKP